MKSAAVILGNRAKAAGDVAGARKQFARAAELEEILYRELAAKGRPDFLVNAISAVSCWIEAGEHMKAQRAAGHALALAKGKDVVPGLVKELSRLSARALEQEHGQ